MRLCTVVTDLDGTLLDSEQCVGGTDRRTLEDLGRRGITRIAATGRSLYSALAVLTPDVPIDFLVHSSGAGILSWPEQRAVRVVHMAPPAAIRLTRELVSRGLDFMLHRALPQNHHFYTQRVRADNHDFERRLQRYLAFASALPSALSEDEPMSHAVVIEPPPAPGRHRELLDALPEFQVIRATSPLDGKSTWIEIYPLGVNKAAASAWIHERQGGGAALSMAVGNDYNDVELLDWANLAFVVNGAPAELRARYATVPSNDEGGFTEAVRRALHASEGAGASAPPIQGSDPSSSVSTSGARGLTRTRS